MVCAGAGAVLRKSRGSAVVLPRTGGKVQIGPFLTRTRCRDGRGLLLEPFDDAPEPVDCDVDAELRAVGPYVRDALGLDVDDAPVALGPYHDEVDVDLGAVGERDDRVHARWRMAGVAVERQHAQSLGLEAEQQVA